MYFESHNDHLHWFYNHPMVEKEFAYISRIGQTKSSRNKFIVILFSRIKVLKSIESSSFVFVQMGNFFLYFSLLITLERPLGSPDTPL